MIYCRLPQHRFQATHMVLMDMGNDHGVQMADLLLRQIFSRTDTVGITFKFRSQGTSTIQQQPVSVIGFHQNGVAISDIDYGYFHRFTPFQLNFHIYKSKSHVVSRTISSVGISIWFSVTSLPSIRSNRR